MPAIRTFALNSAVAILFDFLLQMTAFVALVSLDARRQKVGELSLESYTISVWGWYGLVFPLYKAGEAPQG